MRPSPPPSSIAINRVLTLMGTPMHDSTEERDASLRALLHHNIIANQSANNDNSFPEPPIPEPIASLIPDCVVSLSWREGVRFGQRSQQIHMHRSGVGPGAYLSLAKEIITYCL